MLFLVISFVAGVLTVLTPCVLPILPIVLGGTVADVGDKKRPFIIVASLAVSVFIFTILLKVSSVFINVPSQVWQYLSAIIILFFGLSLLFPNLWATFTSNFSLFQNTNNLLNSSYKKRASWWGPLAIGASLGPVFTTCSPTFFLILATVLPSSLSKGVIYLLAYDIGLSIFLLLIAFLGQKFLVRIAGLSDPQSKLMKGLGILFILLALTIASGFEKNVEARLLGFLDFTKIEMNVRSLLEPKTCTGNSCAPTTTVATSTDLVKVKKPGNYKEIVKPSGFVNSGPFKLADLVGKKVILVDFMTYSCINCQRTYPYLKDWYAKYKDKGLEIVAIQTPEFSFEKNIDNVRKSAVENGLTFPIVLDNDYGTWNAYGNQYWPHKYLIDLNGNMVYDHIGEGNYAETEKEIAKLLSVTPGTSMPGSAEPQVFAQSPETYFGFLRSSATDSSKFLAGKWNIASEYAESMEIGASVTYTFSAKNVYMVAESGTNMPTSAEVYIDGVKTSTITVKDSKLYTLVSLDKPGVHILKIIINSPGLRLYTFTFG